MPPELTPFGADLWGLDGPREELETDLPVNGLESSIFRFPLVMLDELIGDLHQPGIPPSHTGVPDSASKARATLRTLVCYL